MEQVRLFELKPYRMFLIVQGCSVLSLNKYGVFHCLRSCFFSVLYLLPSFMYIQLRTLLNSSTPDAYFPVQLSTATRIRFHVKSASLLIPLYLFHFLCGKGV